MRKKGVRGAKRLLAPFFRSLRNVGMVEYAYQDGKARLTLAGVVLVDIAFQTSPLSHPSYPRLWMNSQ